MADCIGLITSKYDTMTRSERKVADFVIGYLHEAVHMNVHDFSHAAGVSEASVLRFCRRLGFDGFRDFCLQMARNMSVETDDCIVAMQDNASDLEQRVSSTLAANMETIRMTLGKMDFDALRRAGELIHHCRHLMFVGMGTSYIVCQDAALRFLRAGHHATSYSDTHTCTVAISYFDSRDVVVGISHSGTTPEVCEIMALAQKRGVHTIGITTYPNEWIGSVSDLVLQTCIREIPMYKVAITSRSSQLAVIDALFLAALVENYDATMNGLVDVRDNIVSLRDAANVRNTKGTI